MKDKKKNCQSRGLLLFQIICLMMSIIVFCISPYEVSGTEKTIKSSGLIINEPDKSKQKSPSTNETDNKESLSDSQQIREKNEVETEFSKYAEKESSPLLFSNVDLKTETGTPHWDDKNDPGYDSAATNDQVRSYDSILYPLSFSIQATNLEESYTNIIYQIELNLANAWTKEPSGQLRQVAEISTGKLIENTDGTKRSQLIMTGEIGTSGQVSLTPVIDVFGAVHGTVIQPEMKLTLIQAKRADGTIIALNHTVTAEEFDCLDLPKTYVSAKANVRADFGESSHYGLFNTVTGEEEKKNSLVKNIGIYLSVIPLSGRAPNDFKGTTFPSGEIKYEIKQKASFTNNKDSTQKDLAINEDVEPMRAIAYSYLETITMSPVHLTQEFEKYQSSYRPLTLQAFPVPNGKTKKIYKDQPAGSIRGSVGVYDTGNPKIVNTADSMMTVINSDYTPISTGYSYLNNGEPISPNQKPFSSIVTQMELPFEYIASLSDASINYTLSIDQIELDGKKQEVKASQKLTWDNKLNEGVYSYASFNTEKRLALGSSDFTWKSAGDGVISQGSKTALRFVASTRDYSADEITGILRWNTNAVEFDSFGGHTLNSVTQKEVLYGVGEPFPNASVFELGAINNQYTWYNTVEKAKQAGTISAVKATYNVDSTSGSTNPGFWIIGKAKGTFGALDNKGQSNILLANAFSLTKGKVTQQYPENKAKPYQATLYDSQGKLEKNGSPQYSWGDTLYIAPMTIRTTIEPERPSYLSTEQIKWKAVGKIASNAQEAHLVKVRVTLPKGLEYAANSSVSNKGQPAAEPKIIRQNDGSFELTWTVIHDPKNKQNPEISFLTNTNSWDINFGTTGATTLGVNNIGEVNLISDPKIRDTSFEALRSSKGQVNLTKVRQMTISKRVNKKWIEAGNVKDPANTSDGTDMNFTITSVNDSPSVMENVRIIDVLPVNGDSRGSAFSGGYTLKGIDFVGNKGDVWYTREILDSTIDPNKIDLANGWQKFEGQPDELKEAKSILVAYDQVAPSEKVQFTLQLQPHEQRPGNQYVNQASFNSSLNQKIESERVHVKVLGRSLSGIAWFDNNLDGLISDKEEKVKNVSVKLYRTSQINQEYKEKLVTKSLTGKDFINEDGESLIKTDESGFYELTDLPEGHYIVAFDQDKSTRITQKLVGSDGTINSKADPVTGKTEAYQLPNLSELSNYIDETNGQYLIQDINLGLIRPSELRLFKYEAGSARDQDEDGKLGDEEKTSGKALEGAVFELYSENKVEKIATLTTDKYGWLDYEGLFPGNYVLIEVKAPVGYELHKSEIKFSITRGDEVLTLYQENAKVTQLPYTGGSQMHFIMIVIIGIGVITFGLTGYRREIQRRNLS